MPFEHIEGGFGPKMLFDVGVIGVLARGVNYERQVTGGTAHGEIVEDPGRIVREQRVPYATFGEADDVARNQCFQRLAEIGAVQPRLSHMRDVEQACGRARVFVLGKNAGGILHWHVVSGERNHARAQFKVQRMKLRAFEINGGFGHAVP